ncbi:MAG TPA: TetR/AcrR family transcriptional regulator [Acidimicrobiales bacterium]|nr:TetR/AcrR family transcriptional regulator [Acidimicrobiales bacterium]
MRAEGRRYGGRTAEERRESRRTALLDAGYDLYGTVGYRNVSIERVCSHARLTARSFYEEFGSREALLRAVYDRTIAHAAEAVFSAMAAAGDGVRDVAEAGIAAFVHAMLDDPRAARIVHLEVVGVSEGMEGHRRQVLRAFADIVAAEGLRLNAGRVPDGLDPRPTALALVGGGNELIVDWLQSEDKLSLDALIVVLTDLFVAASAGPPDRRPDSRA